MYPVVFFDALRVKIREDAVVRNRAVYLALGVLPDGTRDILGLWIEGTEGAKCFGLRAPLPCTASNHSFRESRHPPAKIRFPVVPKATSSRERW